MAEQGKLTRKEFVKGLPMDLPAKKVVEHARGVGMSLKEADVYTLRSVIRKEQGGEQQSSRGSKPQAASPTSPAVSSVTVLPTSKLKSLGAAVRQERFRELGLPQQFLLIATRIGVDRAEVLLQTLKHRTVDVGA